MSLTKQVEQSSSPAGKFLREVFPTGRNRRLLAEINQELDSHPTIFRLESGTPPYVHGLIGQAIDYRIRYHFRNTPADELRMAGQGAWTATRTGDLIHLLQSSPSRFPDYLITPLGEAPDGDEDWQRFSDNETVDGSFTIWSKPNPKPRITSSMFSELFDAVHPHLVQTKLPLECTLEFFDLLDETVDTISAHRRKPTDVEECRLGRFCLVLAVFESFARSGRGWPPQFLGDRVPGDAEHLLDAVPSSWIEDVALLGATFGHRHADWRGMSATLNPVFAGASDVGGADGDFLFDGCLWDIKTTVERKAKGKWLLQLLGYVLLDYDDKHGIDHVGLLFPRQAADVSWPLQDLVHELSGRSDVSLANLRHKIYRRLRADS